jgi:hypothetical protein
MTNYGKKLITFFVVSKCRQTERKSARTKKIKTGAGKTRYKFSANANILSPNFPFSVLPAGGGGDGSGGGNGKYVGISGKHIR